MRCLGQMVLEDAVVIASTPINMLEAFSIPVDSLIFCKSLLDRQRKTVSNQLLLIRKKDHYMRLYSRKFAFS